MKLFVRLLVLASMALTLVGCTTMPRQSGPIGVEEIIAKTYAAVDHLITQLETGADKSRVRGPIIVATLVNIDELNESSRLGRSLSEQIAARFVQRGYPIIELKLRGNIFVQRNQGELLLSRELRDISLSHKAQAVVVGTYSMAKNFVLVNLKVVSGETQNILAATDYGLPLDVNTQSMLPR